MNKHTNARIARSYPMCTPRQVHEAFPLKEDVQERIGAYRQQFVQILQGIDTRFVIMTGPCSIHNPDSALRYARLLEELQPQVADKIQLIMRVYFEKPRTIRGWQGLIMDPGLDGSCDVNKGLFLAREVLMPIAQIMPVITEFLDTDTPQYIGDLITTGTIGARTILNPAHRGMASGLSMPVGYKNSMDGGVAEALDAFEAAQHAGPFLGIDMDRSKTIFQTTGNPDGYMLLRGGKSGPNYDRGAINIAAEEIVRRKLQNYRIVVDCSHGNSGKISANQGSVFRSVVEQVVAGQKAIAGVMLESNLKAGNQKVIPGKVIDPEMSITDDCINWFETVELIKWAHEQLSAAT